MIKITQYLEFEYLGHPVSVRDGIRHIRKSFDMTRKEFAKEIGLSWRTVESWENGIANPGLAVLVFIKKMMDEKEKNHE
jgi:DNA-binding transcriptional regulator YiaG